MNQSLGDKSSGETNNKDFLPKKVGIVFSEVKREYFPTEVQYITEKDAEHDANIIANYIRKLDIEVAIIPGDENVVETLKKEKPEMVFNLVDSIKGSEYLSAAIPGVLELLGIPYTGVDILGSSLGYNKYLVKKLLQTGGVPVPNSQLFITPNDPLEASMRFPLISKLNEIHGAVEITRDAVSENEKHLRDRLKFLISTYNQPVLVEEFIVGKEVVAYVLEGLNRKVYLGEKVFNKPQDKYVFATFEDQWLTHDNEVAKEKLPYRYEKVEDNVLKEYVKKAFDLTKMLDYGKFDVRVDSSGRYFFIDANSNPAFGPLEIETAMSYILNLHGIDFPEILRRLILNTMRSPVEDYATNHSAVTQISQ